MYLFLFYYYLYLSLTDGIIHPVASINVKTILASICSYNVSTGQRQKENKEGVGWYIHNVQEKRREEALSSDVNITPCSNPGLLYKNCGLAIDPVVHHILRENGHVK
jgi:hypothetical protein